MSGRVDSASRSIAAAPSAVYRAFAEPGAMERWLPPDGMTGEMLHFDFREGGTYRMRLTCAAAHRGHGKTSPDADVAEVRLTKVVPGRCVEQQVMFEIDAPTFEGAMRMTWTMEAQDDRTLVAVRAEGVPPGIRAEDHVAAMTASLEQLAGFVEAWAQRRQGRNPWGPTRVTRGRPTSRHASTRGIRSSSTSGLVGRRLARR